MRNDINIQRIIKVFDAFGEMQNKIVFVGGATLSVYAELPQPDIRPTKDVDVLIEILAYKDYSQLSMRLENWVLKTT